MTKPTIVQSTQPGCPPDCALCAANAEMEAHYDACEICQGKDYPCEAMKVITDKQQAIMAEEDGND